MNDLIPMIDATYRTLADREHRAIAGLSMGAVRRCKSGSATWTSSLHRLVQRRGSQGSIRRLRTTACSPMRRRSTRRSNCSGWRRHCGGSLAPIEPGEHETLEKAGIKNVFFDCPFAHEWQTWRYDLHDFAPRLFR